MMRGLNWKGIALALVMKKIFSYAMSYALSVIGAFKIRALGLNPKDTINYVKYVPQVYTWSLIIATTTSILCGYIAAGNDRKYAVKNALIMGCLAIILSVLTQRSSYEVTPLWFRSIAPVTAIFGALCGGYIRSRRQPKPAKLVPEVLQPPIPLP